MHGKYGFAYIPEPYPDAQPSAGTSAECSSPPISNKLNAEKINYMIEDNQVTHSQYQGLVAQGSR
jgi:hypothetical protein